MACSSIRFLVLAALTGCAETFVAEPSTTPVAQIAETLTLAPEKRPVNSRSAEAATRGSCKRIIMLPPDGEREDSGFAVTLERELLRLDIEVISSAITSRVYEKGANTTEQGQQVASGAKLTDLERALVMAKGSNADCVLKLIEAGFTQDPSSRFFVLSADGKAFTEVARRAYDGTSENRRWFVIGPQMKVRGRLISVSSGLVFVVVDLLSDAVDFVQPMPVSVVGGYAQSNAGAYGNSFNSGEYIVLMRDAMIQQLAKEIVGPQKKGRPPGDQTSPPATQ